MPCVDTDGDLVVTTDIPSHSASHALTFPRACDLPNQTKIWVAFLLRVRVAC
jgi:hypothetical protein